MIWTMVLAPIVVGILLYALPRRMELLAVCIGVLTAIGEVAATVAARTAPDETAPWLRQPFTANFHVGLGQNLAFWLVLLLAAATACALTASRVPRRRDFTAQMLLLLGAMTGVFVARDLLLFALFFDLMLIPVFLVLTAWGSNTGPRSHVPAWRYLLYNLTGGLGLLFAVIAFGVLHGGTDVIGSSVGSGLTEIGAPYEAWIFAGFALAFLIKTPVWPLHTWMPDTYAELPAPAAAIVGAVQSKAGLYGFLAIGMALFPTAMHAAAPYMFVLGAIGLVYGAFAALTQDDIKRVVAYSSLSHLGLMLIAAFSFNPIALGGLIVYIIAHGLFNAALFVTAGWVEEREETRSLTVLGGLGMRNPRLSGALLIAALAALGLPGLCGFAGELLILVGLYQAGMVWQATIALLPIVLAAAYLLRMFQGIMHGPESPDLPTRPDLAWWEVAAVAPLVAAMVLLGVDAGPLARIEPQLVHQVGLEQRCLPPARNPGGALVRVLADDGLTTEQTADVLTACYALASTGEITDFATVRNAYLHGRGLLAPTKGQ